MEVHTKEQIENYEEEWQKKPYFKSGNGLGYIHTCELCNRTANIIRINGGHYICIRCKLELRLPKKDTIKKWKEVHLNVSNKWKLPSEHPSEPSKKLRSKCWKKIIRLDYIIEMFNQQ